MNRFRAAKKASVMRSDTTSKCADLVAKQTNTWMYALINTGLRVCPLLMFSREVPELGEMT